MTTPANSPHRTASTSSQPLETPQNTPTYPDHLAPESPRLKLQSATTAPLSPHAFNLSHTAPLTIPKHPCTCSLLRSPPNPPLRHRHQSLHHTPDLTRPLHPKPAKKPPHPHPPNRPRPRKNSRTTMHNDTSHNRRDEERVRCRCEPVGSDRESQGRGRFAQNTPRDTPKNTVSGSRFLSRPLLRARCSRLHNRHANRAAAEAQTPPLRSSAPSVPARGLRWILAHFVRTSGAQFVAKKFPLRSRIGAPGFVTPHALSKSGVYSESLRIKIAPTECMRCDK